MPDWWWFGVQPQHIPPCKTFLSIPQILQNVEKKTCGKKEKKPIRETNSSTDTGLQVIRDSSESSSFRFCVCCVSGLVVSRPYPPFLIDDQLVYINGTQFASANDLFLFSD